MSAYTASELSEELLRDLAERVGEPEAVTAVLREWFEDIGAENLALVAVLALEAAFANCMTVVQPHEVTPGAITYHRSESAA